jgi:ribosomal subunit interface protein
MTSAVARMEIVVRGRNVEIPDHFRIHVSERLAKLERYDHKIIRTDVELQHERNPRQTDSCQHVEITCRSKGPVVRAEACADDFYKALEFAIERLERRMRSAADRRRVHHGRRRPTPSIHAVAALPADAEPEDENSGFQALPPDGDDNAGADETAQASGEGAERSPGRVVREKTHPAVPMTVDDALFEMELVGHDFYLFHDKVTDCPSVVYRRHAYDYGVIRLGEQAGAPSADAEPAAAQAADAEPGMQAADAEPGATPSALSG